jgi:hypothetical protein
MLVIALCLDVLLLMQKQCYVVLRTVTESVVIQRALNTSVCIMRTSQSPEDGSGGVCQISYVIQYQV